MSLQMRGQLPGYAAAADYTEKQFYLVYISAANTVTLCGAGGIAAGVLINAPDSGEPADVCRLGPAKVKLSGTVAANDPLKSAAGGTAVKADTDKDHIIGWADVAGVTGDIIDILLAPGSLSV